MNSLIIGGAGFIGSHLCDALINIGDNVICLDNCSNGNENNIKHLLGNTRFKFYKEDATDVKTLEKIFESEKIDFVFHLAANSDIQASAANPDVEYKNTYTTTFTILSIMRKYKVKRIFFASTSAVYGDKKDEILDENTPNLSPISYYGAAKLGSEALLSAFSYMNDMSALVFRFPNVIGPRLTHGVIYDFIRKLKKCNNRLEILGDGRQTKPYIYVDDLINAIIMFKDKLKKGVELYNVGVEGATSVTQIANIVCSEMKLNDVKYEYTGGSGGWKGDVPKFQYSTIKIQSEGWCAKYTSDEAVKKTVHEVLSDL